MAGWPLGRPMRLQRAHAAITLEVILRAVFGVEAERMEPLRTRSAELLEPAAHAGGAACAAEPAELRAPDGRARQALDRLTR